MFCNQIGEGGINELATPVYTVNLGLSPAIVGMVLGGMRLWDAVTDPIIGRLSDNSKNPKGRRKPFMFKGAILTAIVYPLVWMASPEWSDHAKTIYFILSAIAFFTCYTIFSVPFRALGTEMTPDYKERTEVSVFTAYANKVFYLMLPWTIALAHKNWLFENPVVGIRVVTAIVGVLVLVAGLIPAIKCEERYAKVAQKQKSVNLLSSFKDFLSDKTFLCLHGMGLGLLCSGTLVTSLGMFVNIYYVWGGDTSQGFTVGAYGANITQILGFAMLIVLKKYLMHIEKKRLITGVIILAFFGSAAKWFLYTPENPYLTLLLPIFFAPIYTGLWAIFMSLLGDYCDYDEHKNGNRREGVFAAVSGWMMKAGGSLSLAVSGLLVVMTGFNRDLGGDQSDEVFLAMKLVFIFVPLACFIVTLVMSLLYPLDGERMIQIRKELEERRGKV
jgi:GPH family glycoside/pentoside/hexuronide:cation symporter